MLRHSFGVDIQFLLLDGGKLEEAYQHIAPLSIATSDAALRTRLKTLAERGYTHAIINTTAAAHILPQVREAGIDASVLVHELPRIIREKNLTPGARAASRTRVADRFDFKAYVRRLLHLAIPDPPSVSVVLPNYNYARHMKLRLGSIFTQSHPVHEVIVLDDASTDDSATVIPAVAAQWSREIRFIANTVNSGSVFRQWRRAAELAEGEFVWPAEADDSAEPDFLARAMALLAGDDAIQFVFTDSRTIDTDGAPQWAS
ncbi:MAG: glycosyltransferase family 2 protein [Rhodopila sp.]